MKPLEFKEQNTVFAKDQPEYRSLPALNNGREVVFCMGMTFTERLRVLLTGKVWVSLLMFGKPLTPSFFTTRKSDLIQNTVSIKGNNNTVIQSIGKEVKRTK